MSEQANSSQKPPRPTDAGCSASVGRYRKRPVVIEAIQWLGDNFVAVDEFVTCNHVTNPREGRVAIETLEGTMLATIGDWIIRGVNGEFYPCKDDIFVKTYEVPLAP